MINSAEGGSPSSTALPPIKFTGQAADHGNHSTPPAPSNPTHRNLKLSCATTAVRRHDLVPALYSAGNYFTRIFAHDHTSTDEIRLRSSRHGPDDGSSLGERSWDWTPGEPRTRCQWPSSPPASAKSSCLSSGRAGSLCRCISP